jgi:hypothetical protein
VKAWKGVLIVWFVSFLLVSLVASPIKSALSAGLGNSTIADQLKNGINIEVFADLKANFGGIGSYFSKGLLMIVLIWFVVNSFISGGIFNSLRNGSGEFSSQEFFRISAKKFWSICVISLIMSILILSLAIFIVIIPVSLLSTAEKTSEVIIVDTAMLLSSIFLFIVIILLISSDYARAWQVSHEKNACFKAINFGLRQTFRTFFSSYPLMLIIIVIQVLYMWLVLKILHGINPQSGFGIFILFLTSQFLFILKLFLKTWRYGSITSMMESNMPEEKPNLIADIDKVQVYEI